MLTALVLAVVAIGAIGAPSAATRIESSAGAAPHVAEAACATDPATPKHQFRAQWIASVANIDWPSEQGLTVAEQQAEFNAWLDRAEQLELNAVVVQIRPTADAFWPSPYEPWSEWLTGTQGEDPGYDPLAFAVEAAHQRNIEFHAWFNAYRVSNQADPDQLSPDHPFRQHPGWGFEYGGKLYYNPGIPDVRSFVENAMLDAVERYDVDGVHFDDYFYPYPVAGESIPDEETYEEYGAGFDSIDDWRRNNVDLMVQEMSDRISATKPWVKFGVSPFGIWRNKSTDPLGSDTNGLQSYDAIYADSRKWVTEEWIDYITPQIYWHVGHPAADYAALVPWWSGVVTGTDVQLYIGQAAYRVGTDPAWDDPAELSNHLYLNRDHSEVVGDVYFSAKDLAADRLGGVSQLVDEHYSRPALVPVFDGGGAAPPAPQITAATRTPDGVELQFAGSGSPAPASYAVYRLDGDGDADPCAFADATNLLGTSRGDAAGGSFTDATAAPGQTYSYYVSALDRDEHESDRSAPAVVEGDGGGEPWTTIIDNATTGQFTASGNWGTSSWSDQRYGGDYRFATPVAASDPAWFSAEIPEAGSYHVEVWYPAAAGYNSATPFIVQAADGSHVTVVDQRSGGGHWVNLGWYELAAGHHDVVGVSRWTAGTGYVIADAVRLTRS